MSERRQTDSDSINIFDLIDSICADFRREWKAGACPRIGDYLLKVPKDARSNLFRNLLQLEVRYRGQAGEVASSEEYIRRFPEFKRLIRLAFDDPSMISMEAMGSTPGSNLDTPTVTLDVPAANRIGDYELIRELGRGAFGVVYEAKHVTRGNRVALKTLPTGHDGQEINAERLHRFRKEFRSLAEINHPNLVGMQTLEVDGSQWFFTMDLIEGQDFRSWVRPGDRVDEPRLRSALRQLAGGIMALHQRGIVHRDLKPRNVLVEPDGRVAILDFGLVAEMQRATDLTQTRSAMFAGTPKYAAPEQLYGQRSEASDWYALGVMVYEAFKGEAPFEGPNPMDLLRRKQHEDPPTLSGSEDVPEDLATLVDGMLQREPTQRLTTTAIAELLNLDSDTRGQGSTATVGSQGSHGSSASSAEDLDSSLLEDEEIVLIGRETQLRQLEEARQELLSTRKPVVVWITGLSGEGKSSLAEKFLRPYRRGSEMLVLSGRCYDRESVPFKAIDSIIDPLVRYLRPLSDDENATILPDDIEMLAQLFPLLNRVRPIASRMNKQILSIDSKQIRYRAFEALRALLVSIGKKHPVALMIDDLQWGDADSAAALHALLFGNDPPPVLFLGAYRRDEMDESSFHRLWSQLDKEKETSAAQREIALQPLDQEQCIALVSARAGMPEDAARDVVARLFENTRGNPYFLDQMIEGFNVDSTDWQPMPLKDIVARKLVGLPKGSEQLLKYVAIAGKATQTNELAAISETGSGVLSLLTHMRSERLVRLVGSGEGQLVDTWHDKIRETMLERMDPDDRRAMHLKYAESIESSEGLSASAVETYLSQPFTTQSPPEFSTTRVYDLAYHFQLAGDRRAFYFQFLAGELAFQTYASEESIEYLTRTCNLLKGDEPSRWLARLWYRLATSSYRVMNFDKAIEQFEAGIQFAESGLERAFFYSGIATVHQTRAGYDSARRFHDLALREINRKRVQGLPALPTAVLGFAKLACFPESWLRGKFPNTKEDDRLEQSIYIDLTQYFYDSAVSIVEELEVLMRLGILSYRSDSAGFASGVGMLAAYTGISGFPKLGRRHARRAAAKHGKTTDPELEGICRYTTAVALTCSGQFAEADEEFAKAIPLLEKTGSHFHGAIATHMHRHLHEGFGTAGSEIESARKLIELTSKSGNLRSLCWGQYDLAAGLARLGRIADSIPMIEEAQATWERRSFNLMTPIYFAQRSFVFLQASEYELAESCSDNSWRIAVKHLRVMDVSLRGLPWYLECVAGPHWSTEPHQVDRQLVRRRCRWARLLGFFHLKIRPHLLRSRGRAFTALGQARKGIRNFERAANSARQLGMKYDLAKSLLDLAAVKAEGRDENRAEAIRLLKEMESVIPRAESWLLGDQYDEAVVAPEFDLEAWERDHGVISKPDYQESLKD